MLPGPRPWFPLANLYAMAKRPLSFLTETAREYGDVSSFRLGRQTVYLFNDPDLIRDVLVTHDRSFMKSRALQRTRIILGNGLLTSEGEFHRRQRRLVAPAFHRERIARYNEIIVANAKRVSSSWRDGQEINVADEMMRLALAIVGEALFGTDVSSEADEIRAALSELVDNFNVTLAPFMSMLDRLPLPMVRAMRRAIERLDRTVYGMIEQRRREGGDRGDLLSMLLLAQDEEGSGGMTDEQVRDEVMTLFLAGHETTANALSWSWYLLSQNPQFEAPLNALPVFSEAMRLYPPAWLIGRMAQDDVTIRDVNIARGSIVIMSQWVMHRDPRWWPDPERFDPSRFVGTNTRPKFSYFPFGGGSRICVGEGFAWAEGVAVLETIAAEWKLRLAQERPPVPQPRITLRPKGGIRMRVQRH
jgi:cytochrome P450